MKRGRKILRASLRLDLTSSFFLLLLLVPLFGCGVDEAAGAASQKVLRVAAAANTRPAMEEIIEQYQIENPGTKVEVVYGSSGNFHAQIVQGAPFDIFFSADTVYPRDLVRRLQLEQEPFPYAKGRIVLWQPDDSTIDLDEGLEAIRSDRVQKIAIANPDLAPYGKAAIEVIEQAGLGDVAASKLVRASNIVEALQFAETGAADLGIIAYSLVRAPNMRGKGHFLLLDERHTPILQDGLVLPGESIREANDFRDFVLGEKGAQILDEFGFETSVDHARIE